MVRSNNGFKVVLMKKRKENRTVYKKEKKERLRIITMWF